MKTYRGFDLEMRSAIGIPGALLIPDTDASHEPDLLIEEAVLPAGRGKECCGPYARLPDGSLLIELPRAARFIVYPDGRRMAVQGLSGASSDTVAAYLIATALPAALWMRGDLVLHAAAAMLPGRSKAMIILGHSGSGKSDLLQMLLGRGASVVAEDSLCLRTQKDTASVSGLPGCLFLRSAGATLGAERRLVDVPFHQRVARAALGSVVVLRPEASAGSLPKLPKMEALQQLMVHRHRATIARIAGLEGALLPTLARIADTVPTYACNVRGIVPDELFQHLLKLPSA